jgi:hypothetical protein
MMPVICGCPFTSGASGFAIEFVAEATSPAARDLPGEQATQRDTVA